jgi:hypothetical protein
METCEIWLSTSQVAGGEVQTEEFENVKIWCLYSKER